jgi:hypothetical protein
VSDDRIRLAPKDGSDGRVVVELPMSATLAAQVMNALDELGFEFEHIVDSEVVAVAEK